MPLKSTKIAGEMQQERLHKKSERQILVFKVASDELGLDISCVREVLRPQKIYPLPKTPDFIKGVIHLRGHIVAIIDLRKRLHAKQIEEEPNQKLILCGVNRFIVGLTVNSLREIITLSEEDIKPPPEVVSMHLEAEVISGLARVGERIIPVLDLEHIITKKDIIELSALRS